MGVPRVRPCSVPERMVTWSFSSRGVVRLVSREEVAGGRGYAKGAMGGEWQRVRE
jgi:hypothetical protein